MNRARKLFGSPKATITGTDSEIPTNPSPTSKPSRRTMNKVQSARLQTEVKQLRTNLRNGAGTEDLRFQLQEQHEENQRKDQELRNLNDKFHDIHKGLVEVEEERQKLLQSKQQLEIEKKKIQGQLEMREKEVLSLVRRCSSQEGKVKEAVRMRADHGALSVQVENQRTSLLAMTQEISKIEELKEELRVCQESKLELQARLSKLKKDHDDVVETLNSCFTNMQKMTESNHEREEDRRRENQMAVLDLEKQRLAHIEATAELRYELERRQVRLDHMEGILKENTLTNTALRKERANDDKVREAELLIQSLEHETQLANLKVKHDDATIKSQDEYQVLLNEFHSSIGVKDALVTSLENEVSSLMQKLMAISSDLQEIQDENDKDRCANLESLSIFEKDMRLLQEKLLAKDNELTVLHVKTSILESENLELSQKLQQLIARCAELEEENAFIMDLEDQLLEVNYEVVENEEEHIMAEEEHKLAIECLRDEYECQRTMWSSMEKGLVEKVTSLEKERIGLVGKLNSLTVFSKSSLADLQGRLQRSDELVTSLKCSIEILREAVQEKDGRLESINATLDEERCKFLERDAINSGLRFKIDELCSISDFKIDTMEETLSTKSGQIAGLQAELAKERTHIAENDEKCHSLQAQLESIRGTAERDLGEVYAIVQEKEATLRSLLTEIENEKISSHESKLRFQELEAKLSLCRQENERILRESASSMAERDESILMLTQSIRKLNDDHKLEEEAQRIAIRTKDDSIESLKVVNDERLQSCEQMKLSNKIVFAEKTTLLQELQSERKKSLETEFRIKQVESALSSFRHGSQCAALKQSTSIAENEEQILLLTLELERVRVEKIQMEEARCASDAKKDQLILCLQANLAEQDISFEQLKLSHQVVLSEKNVSISLLNDQIDALKIKKVKDDEEKCLLLKDKENRIVSLRHDLKVFSENSLDRNEINRKEISSLTIKLQDAVTELAIAEDEIRDLKFIDLKEAEEAISILEQELSILRKENNILSRNAEHSQSDLECQFTQLRARSISLERVLQDSKHIHEKTVDTMQLELGMLKEDNLRLTKELQEKFDKLQERHSTIASLTSKISTLEASERRFECELRSLYANEEKVTRDYETVALALERELQNQKVIRGDFDLERQKLQASLQNALANTEMKIASREEQIVKLEVVIDDRSRLLADMVSHNKETEEANTKAHSRIIELELTIDSFRIEKENTKAEIDRLAILLQRKEDHILDALQDERQRREIAENDLATANSNARLAKSDNKDLKELERENLDLKDKVRRQEAYLKRKLEKDKVLRERAAPNEKIFKERAIMTTQNVMATPSHSKIPTKIKTPARSRIPSPLKRCPVSTSRMIQSSSQSITTTLSDTSSFPDEWESIY